MKRGFYEGGQPPLSTRAAGEKQLKVFSWCASGGEAAALDALLAVYKKQHPGVEIVSATVAGGGGFAARSVLHTRLAGGNLPDTWQSHAGWELLGQYVEPGYCQPVTDLYKSDDWDKAFPKALVNLITKDGNTYAALAGIHRGNVHWYNKKILSKRLKENMFMRTLFLRIKRASLKEYCPPSPVFL